VKRMVEIEVVKTRGSIDTVILVNGRRYVYDPINDKKMKMRRSKDVRSKA